MGSPVRSVSMKAQGAGAGQGPPMSPDKDALGQRSQPGGSSRETQRRVV